MLKPIDEIPKGQISRAQQIQQDIQEAIDKGINKFEFIGDYNYNTLQQYATQTANRIIRIMLAKRYRELREQYNIDRHTYLSLKQSSEYRPKFIAITSIKGEERRRVFCEIDLSEFEERTEEVFINAMERRKHET